MKPSSKERIILFTKLTIPINIVTALGKILIGVLMRSAFMFFNAFYSVGIVIAKLVAIKLPLVVDCKVSKQELERQYDRYYMIGIIIVVASLCYALYSTTMFYKSSTAKYPMEIGIGLACISFTELFISIDGSVSARKNKALKIEAIKMINLASTLIGFVLTQAALLSFSFDGDPQLLVIANAVSGIVFGLLACAVGIYVIAHTNKVIKNSERWRKECQLQKN